MVPQILIPLKNWKLIMLALAVNFIIGVALAHAQDGDGQRPSPLILTDGQVQYSLSLYLEVLEDPSGELTIHDVASPEYDGRFTPSQEKAPNYGITGSAYWVRFRARNETEQAGDWLMEVGFALIQYADLYIPSAAGDGFDTHQTGFLRPFKTRDIPFRHIVFNLPLPPKSEETFYLRFQSDGPLILPLTIWSPAAFARMALAEQMGLGIFFGALIIMLGYNLFLLFSLREKPYLYYVLFLMLVLLMEVVIEGLVGQYLWPTRMALNFSVLRLIYGLLLIAMLKFTASFLLKEVQIRWLQPLFTGFLIVWGVLILLIPFVDHGFLIRLKVIWGLITLVLILTTGVLTASMGYRPARLFLLSWLGLIIGIMLLLLVRLGVLPSTLLTEQSWRIGVIWLVLFWSLALADRINLLKARAEQVIRELAAAESQKDTAQKALQEAHDELEQRVVERTQELSDAHQHLQEEINVQLEQAQLLAAAAERSRLARDLHDSVTQTLFSANLVAEVLPQLWQRDPQAAQQSLEELGRLTRGALSEMRTLLLELRPEVIIKTPLGELIAQLTEAVTSHSQMLFKLYIENVPTLPPDVHITFYRIAQEALNNVVKHAGGSQVTVTLNASPDLSLNAEEKWSGLVRLVVLDDGRGFAADPMDKEKMGLGIMRERAAAIDADLTIESRPDRGTQVILIWQK